MILFLIEFAVAYLFCGIVCAAFMIDVLRKQSHEDPTALEQIRLLVKQGAFGDEDACRRLLVRMMLVWMMLIWPRTLWITIRDRKNG